MEEDAMALPRAVQEAASKADNLIANEKQKKTGKPRKDEQKAPESPTLVMDDDSDADDVPGGDDFGIAEAPTPQPNQQAPQANPQSADPNEHPDTQRYRVLQGKYNKEISELQQANQQLNREVDQLRGLIAGLQHANQSPERTFSGDAPPSSGNGAADLDITAEEREEFGEDLISLVERIAKRTYQPAIDKLARDNANLRNQVGSVSGQVSQTAVWAKLDKEVEDWQTINNDPTFKQWLQRVDPLAGEVRGRMLKSAFDRGQGDRVVSFFKQFKQEHAGEQQPTPDDQRRQQPVDLGTLAGPRANPGGGSEDGDQQPKKIWKTSEITAFYRKVNAGEYAKRPKLKQRLERDIFAAQSEGRVRRG